MKTTPLSARPLMPADPKIVKKARRDNAAYAAGALTGEQNQDYLHQPNYNPQVRRRLEFGRPGL